jgi:serine/threonine-protein kinase
MTASDPVDPGLNPKELSDFLGPYKVERLLGQGGMGIVYEGTHAKTGQRVAIKVIANSLADQERFRRRFAAEVETLKKLQHPHIIQLIGYGEEKGKLFYSMEFVKGESLHHRIKRDGPMQWRDVCRLISEMCAALKTAHDQGVVHRDLKPANIMLDLDGNVKLADFGIAKFFGGEEMTAAGSIVGTADYMPPEQAEGKPVTSKSDLYSVGSIAYFALTGRPPFVGRSVPEVLYSVRYEHFPPVRTLAPKTPGELEGLIHELLQKDPAKRPPTALVIGNRVRAIRHGLDRAADMAGESPEEKSSPHPPSQEELPADAAVEPSSIDSASVLREKQIEMRNSQTGYSTRIADPNRDPPSEASSAPLEKTAATLAASPSKLMPDPTEAEVAMSRKSEFTTLEEMKRRERKKKKENEWEAEGWHWTSIFFFLLALAVGFWGWRQWTRLPSDDVILEKTMAAFQQEDFSIIREHQSWLNNWLLEQPMDPRQPEVRKMLSALELRQAEREVRSRLRDPQQAPSPIEQMFLNCQESLRHSPWQAGSKMRAFLTVFGPQEANLSSQEAALVTAVRHWTQAQQTAIDQKNDQPFEELQQWMEHSFEQLPESKQAEFLSALAELYSDNARTLEAIERLRKKSLTPPSASP